MTTPAPGARAVLIPAGRPLDESARWIGHACWTELRFHRAITGWLSGGVDPESALLLWPIRAHRAELAEAWHRRLPELRERPRAEQVTPSRTEVSAWFERIERPVPGQTARPHTTRQVAALVLAALAEGYDAHLSKAVGPADAPTVETLTRGIELTARDLASLGDGATDDVHETSLALP